MYKIVPPGAFDFGDFGASLVKKSSRGMIGYDRSQFVKRASSSLLDSIDADTSRRGEVLVLLPALGTTEGYGPNRNGDGFRFSECKKAHHTFVKHARPYRHHDNKPTSPAYGRVIASALNEPMHRVELVVGLNETKEAADRNRGHIADFEINALERGEPLAWSMACKIAFDVCSSCRNKARTRADYCDGSHCKHGGLRNNIARTFDDGHTLHADNPDPVFFDISRVRRPADRIAYAFGRIDKAASAVIKCGAELAEDFNLGPASSVFGAQSSPELLALADSERDRGDVPSGMPFAFDSANQPPIFDFPSYDNDPQKFASLLGSLAAERVLLAPRDFLMLITGDRDKSASAAPALLAALPGVFNRLVSDSGDSENPYVVGRPTTVQRNWAAKYADTHGMAIDRLRLRAQRAAIRSSVPSPRIKQAANGSESLARQYALYQTAFVAGADSGLIRLVALHNRYTQ